MRKGILHPPTHEAEEAGIRVRQNSRIKPVKASARAERREMPRKLTALSLFAGAGGMDIGVSQAGFQVLASVEIDQHCCTTLRAACARKRHKPMIIEKDIRQVDPMQLMEQLGLQPGGLDLLCGGPPCQAFSQIGKQEALGDERGLLLFEMTRFAEVFRPKSILIEQVKGLLSARDAGGSRGGVFQMLLSDLVRLGYVPKWKILNAADYGVPQRRQRVFIVATEKPNGFKYPDPTHCSHDQASPLFPLPFHVTVGEAIAGLGRPSLKNGHAREDSHVDATPDGDRRRIHGVPEGSCLAMQAHLPKEQRCNLTKKDTTKYLRLARGRVSNTLRCGEIFFHPLEDRYLTPRESMRLHGYPDDYALKGPIRGRSGRVTKLDQHRQVANSVPPPVAKALAKEIIVTICQKYLNYSAIM